MLGSPSSHDTVALPDRAKRWGEQTGVAGQIFLPPLKPLAIQKCYKNSYYDDSLLWLAETKTFSGRGRKSRQNVLVACSTTMGFDRCQSQTSTHTCSGDPSAQLGP